MRIVPTVSGSSFVALVFLVVSCGTDAASVTGTDREGGADDGTADAAPSDASNVEASVGVDTGGLDAAPARDLRSVLEDHDGGDRQGDIERPHQSLRFPPTSSSFAGIRME